MRGEGGWVGEGGCGCGWVVGTCGELRNPIITPTPTESESESESAKRKFTESESESESAKQKFSESESESGLLKNFRSRVLNRLRVFFSSEISKLHFPY